MMLNPDASAIFGLDLDPIKVKLMHAESGEGWSREYADAVEFEYRRFLYLMKKFPHEHTAPMFDVDIFWHYHILDTMKYAVDCDAIFGYFLHHFPYVGLRGEEDLAAHHRVGERMGELYEQTFGDPYLSRQPAMRSPASDKTAFSAATARVDGRTAFSAAIGRTAFSAAIGRTSFSAAIGKVAFSAATAKTAFSAASVQSIGSDTQGEATFAGIPGRLDSAQFYSTRPTLAGAA